MQHTTKKRCRQACNLKWNLPALLITRGWFWLFLIVEGMPRIVMIGFFSSLQKIERILEGDQSWFLWETSTPGYKAHLNKNSSFLVKCISGHIIISTYL